MKTLLLTALFAALSSSAAHASAFKAEVGVNYLRDMYYKDYEGNRHFVSNKKLANELIGMGNTCLIALEKSLLDGSQFRSLTEFSESYVGRHGGGQVELLAEVKSQEQRRNWIWQKAYAWLRTSFLLRHVDNRGVITQLAVVNGGESEKVVHNADILTWTPGEETWKSLERNNACWLSPVILMRLLKALEN